MYNFTRYLMTLIIVLSMCSVVVAEDKGGDDLAAKTQNPVGAMYSLPFKFTFDYGANNGEASFLNIQPVIPVTVGKWNLINRVIVPLIYTDGMISGTPEIPNPIQGDGASGLGDINYSVYVSPADPGKIIWGVGPSLMLKTATDDQLGSGKWSLGPTAVILVQPNLGPAASAANHSCQATKASVSLSSRHLAQFSFHVAGRLTVSAVTGRPV